MDKEKTLRKLREEIEEVRKKYGVEFAEVVRCKDCTWWHDHGCAIRIVDETDETEADDFCSFGERRDSDAAD